MCVSQEPQQPPQTSVCKTGTDEFRKILTDSRVGFRCHWGTEWPDAVSMTTARSILAPKGAPGVFHCVSCCVRRAWLCGEDRESGRSFEHRRAWVEDRIHQLAEVFAVAIWGFAVMSNHVHVVVELQPDIAASWSGDEVAARWTRLYCRRDLDPKMRAETLAGSRDRVAILRERLADLSWFMRCLSEPIARRANREDGCKGHFMSMDGPDDQAARPRDAVVRSRRSDPCPNRR